MFHLFVVNELDFGSVCMFAGEILEKYKVKPLQPKKLVLLQKETPKYVPAGITQELGWRNKSEKNAGFNYYNINVCMQPQCHNGKNIISSSDFA